MKKLCVLFASFVVLTACNSVYMHPGTMTQNSIIHAKPGGYAMKRSIKENLERRGYDVRIGKLHKTYGDDEDKELLQLPANTRYVVRVNEKEELFMPWWCMFNGFWWWRFSVSITDQHNGKEILSWRGRGCQNSSLRKLDDILNELEKN